MGYLKKLNLEIWGAKFRTRPHKKFAWVKNMSKTDKNIVQKAASKTNAAMKNEECSTVHFYYPILVIPITKKVLLQKRAIKQFNCGTKSNCYSLKG
jgi:hypothetical protein